MSRGGVYKTPWTVVVLPLCLYRRTYKATELNKMEDVIRPVRLFCCAPVWKTSVQTNGWFGIAWNVIVSYSARAGHFDSSQVCVY